MLIDNHVQQIVLWKTQNLKDQRGDQPSKNRENLDLSSDSAQVLKFSM